MKKLSKEGQAKNNHSGANKSGAKTEHDSGVKNPSINRPAFSDASSESSNAHSGKDSFSSTHTSRADITQDNNRRIVSQRALSNIVEVDRAVEKVVELPVDRIVEVEKEIEKACGTSSGHAFCRRCVLAAGAHHVYCAARRALNAGEWPVSYTHLTLPTIYSV